MPNFAPYITALVLSSALNAQATDYTVSFSGSGTHAVDAWECHRLGAFPGKWRDPPLDLRWPLDRVRPALAAPLRGHIGAACAADQSWGFPGRFRRSRSLRPGR